MVCGSVSCFQTIWPNKARLSAERSLRSSDQTALREAEKSCCELLNGEISSPSRSSWPPQWTSSANPPGVSQIHLISKPEASEGLVRLLLQINYNQRTESRFRKQSHVFSSRCWFCLKQRANRPPSAALSADWQAGANSQVTPPSSGDSGNFLHVCF